MQPFHDVGVVAAQRGRYHRAPVAAVGKEPFVAQDFSHQLAPYGRDPEWVHAALARLVGEAVSGQRGHDHVERSVRIGSKCGRVRQRGDDILEFDERGRPAVREHHGLWVRALAADVDEMDLQSVDLGPEMRVLVETLFLGAPVEVVLPIVAEFAHVPERGTVFPPGAFDLPRPAGPRQALAQIREHRVLDTDVELLDHRFGAH